LRQARGRVQDAAGAGAGRHGASDRDVPRGVRVALQWVSADDGLLVCDLNENGKIDDVTELSGSPTIDYRST
jgi:hypothetical protein